MSAAFVVLKLLLAIALTGAAAADFARQPQILANMARAGVAEAWLPLLGALKAAGALGLLVGFAVPLIGTAAAVGVSVFFVGAIVTHLRAHYYALAPAVVFEVLAVAVVTLGVVSSQAGLGGLSL